MNALEIVRLAVLVGHFFGLALLLGTFLFQVRTRSSLTLRPMLVGAIVQLVSGIALIATRRLQGLPVVDEKMIVKFVVALAVLSAVIIAVAAQRRGRAAGAGDRAARPWFYAAGILAGVNVVIAAVWQ
ncbi:MULTISPECIES: hypothetical protein [unclassified Microbacterium]|uniref:hypothetical protein n=1 Tax=unclassified Microbacterium TaxID=2609290 RepID=UPI00214C456B|nr:MULTISPECIES: hypothetical protein [unclassified Microbacterium]MCR2783532.1 hypothetical protein [Microbacterium sp. zg.B96]WIM15607.1 hypothetical protein QNO11_13865 [Microbacterium sp. zg-B96]